MKKEDLFHHLIGGKIPPISIAVNWNQDERKQISHKMLHKESLTEADILNVDACIEDGEKRIRAEVNDTYPGVTGRIIIFTGCWDCQPLKKLLTDRGYKISPCGNNFDIWI